MPNDFTELRTAIDTHHTEVVERQTEMADRLSDMEKLVAREIAFQPAPGGVRPASAERSAFVNFVRSGGVTDTRAMTIGSGADGGVTVPKEIDAAIADQLRDISPMRRLASVVSVSTSDYRKLVNKRGSAANWRGETEDVTETGTPGFAEIIPPIGELNAMPKVSQHLLDDSQFDVAGLIISDLADLFGQKEGAAFISGDGTNKPKGFLSYGTPVTTADASRAFGVLQYVASGAAGAFASTDPADALISLLYKLRPAYRSGDGVAWLMNSTTASVIRKFKDSTGRFLWTDSLVEGQPPQLLGFPVHEAEDMPDVAANSFPVAFGNWRRGYQIVDRIGTTLLRDPFTSKGHVLFYSAKRVGGALIDSNAIKLLKMAAS